LFSNKRLNCIYPGGSVIKHFTAVIDIEVDINLSMNGSTACHPNSRIIMQKLTRENPKAVGAKFSNIMTFF
jgi:hypothetical protein